MEMKNETYDLGKWLVLIFLPALAVFIGGMGDLYAWSESTIWVGTINLLAVFLGAILQLSSLSYHKEINVWKDDSNGPTCT